MSSGAATRSRRPRGRSSKQANPRGERHDACARAGSPLAHGNREAATAAARRDGHCAVGCRHRDSGRRQPRASLRAPDRREICCALACLCFASRRRHCYDCSRRRTGAAALRRLAGFAEPWHFDYGPSSRDAGMHGPRACMVWCLDVTAGCGPWPGGTLLTAAKLPPNPLPAAGWHLTSAGANHAKAHCAFPRDFFCYAAVLRFVTCMRRNERDHSDLAMFASQFHMIAKQQGSFENLERLKRICETIPS